MRGVLQDREHLGVAGEGEQRGPADERTDEAAVGVQRPAHAAAGLRTRGAELDQDEGDERDREAGDQPGDERGGAGDLRSVERAEQPAGADDAAEGCGGQAPEAEIVPQPLLLSGERLRGGFNGLIRLDNRGHGDTPGVFSQRKGQREMAP
jgi:hypothetical protein